jgi:hypothetical protein
MLQTQNSSKTPACGLAVDVIIKGYILIGQ